MQKTTNIYDQSGADLEQVMCVTLKEKFIIDDILLARL